SGNIVINNLSSSPLSSSPLRSSPIQSYMDEDSMFNIPKTPTKAKKTDNTEHKNAAVEGLLEFIVSICVNSIVDPKIKPLTGLETLLKVHTIFLLYCRIFVLFLKIINKFLF